MCFLDRESRVGSTAGNWPFSESMHKALHSMMSLNIITKAVEPDTCSSAPNQVFGGSRGPEWKNIRLYFI